VTSQEFLFPTGCNIWLTKHDELRVVLKHIAAHNSSGLHGLTVNSYIFLLHKPVNRSLWTIIKYNNCLLYQGTQCPTFSQNSFTAYKQFHKQHACTHVCIHVFEANFRHLTTNNLNWAYTKHNLISKLPCWYQCCGCCECGGLEVGCGAWPLYAGYRPPVSPWTFSEIISPTWSTLRGYDCRLLGQLSSTRDDWWSMSESPRSAGADNWRIISRGGSDLDWTEMSCVTDLSKSVSRYVPDDNQHCQVNNTLPSGPYITYLRAVNMVC